MIRRRVLSRHPGYEAGARIFPQRLTADLGVSMTPVREALQLLSAEGLIVSSPRRGFTVVDLSDSDLADLVTLRVEPELVALRFRGPSAQEGKELRAHLAACEKALG